MAGSRQRIVYVGLLALALVGLGVDKFVLSGSVTGPQSSFAAAPAALQAGDDLLIAKTAAAAPAPAVPKEDVAMGDLARRLAQLGPVQASPVTLPEAFSRALVRPTERREPQPVAVVDPPKVSAVLLGSRPAVVAGGKPLVLGADVEGWKVIAIESEAVTFERDGVRASRQVR
jgi:hypothetical protein